MISLNDVLLAMSNIPVDDPIAEIWGRGLQGGYRIIEYTGSLPITITANGDALIDYRIYGTDGGVGEPTENLFDKNTVTPKTLIKDTTGEVFTYPYYDTTGMMDIENNFVITFVKNVSSYKQNIRVAFYDIQNDFISSYHNAEAISPLNITVPTGTKKVRVSYSNGVYPGSSYPNDLFIGLTAPADYIPYGYKLPMTVSDGNTMQSVPVYIGENQLDSVEGVSDYVDKSSGKIVRMIGEYTFTGDESFNKYGNSDVFYTSTTIDPVGITTVNTITMRCDHPAFTAIENKDTRYWLNPEADDICCFLPGGRSQVFLRSTSNFTTVAECQAYLKSQYDNGTPVKISYWLKTPVEEAPPVPFPEIPTIDGETVIDYDGDPKPSQMYVKYRGKSGGA